VEGYFGILTIVEVVRVYVLGPRLILSVREYHATIVADSDPGNGMTTTVFWERVQVSTGSTV